MLNIQQEKSLEKQVMIAVGIKKWGQINFCKTAHSILKIPASRPVLSLWDKRSLDINNQFTHLQKPDITSSRTDDKYSNVKSDPDKDCTNMVKRVATYSIFQGVGYALMKKMATKSIHK